MLKILGFSGSVQEGLDDLKRAADHSRYAKYEAGFLLAMMDMMMNKGERGEMRRLDAIHRALPDSPFISYLYAALLLSDRFERDTRDLPQGTVTFHDAFKANG